MGLTAWAREAKDKRETWMEMGKLRKRIEELEKERDKLHKQVMVLTHTKEFDYVDDPQFVTNFNNIDIAFQVHSLEQQAKGVREALTKANVKPFLWRGGGFLHECLFEDYIHDLQTQAETLKEQE